MAAERAAAAVAGEEEEEELSNGGNPISSPSLSSYLGLSFYVFLGFLPKSYLSFISSLQSRNRTLSLKLLQAEEQLKQMRSHRKEDSKANAKVVEIFASHRNSWQQEEKRLLQQIDASTEEIACLKAKIEDMEKSEAELRICVEKLRQNVEERDEMIGFMSRKADDEEDVKEAEIRGHGSKSRATFGRNGEEGGDLGEYCTDFSRIGRIRVSQGLDPVPEACFMERIMERNAAEADGMAVLYGQRNGFGRDFLPSASVAWMERSSEWQQDLQYDTQEPLYHTKHFVARESPWKVDGESTGVSSKLKLLEQELLNLERVGNGELSKVPSLMRKQAKRYQALAGKIDDLCRRMQASDPCEPTLSSEFRTQRQTEFLIETFRLQQRAIETGQKLTVLQAETVKSFLGDDLGGQAKVTTRRSLDSIRNNFKEIQRNLEIWLARIMGDLEGILARDGASRVREYYMSRYPFIR
ncbi:uncharacterized protein LOC131247932 isoform X2 [Magnolia sinica]|uniref:uncharacterized protein LOC131247932 isoform X2 n=1 Tax=Magnolia sinica TaxID=86752 RepID=UPI00265857EF|nr:uncharacterized protein LOC131247932 isoform X2 [Magnolia sinica]